MNSVERGTALVALVEAERLAVRSRMLEEARSEAAVLIAQAHAQARERVRKLMKEESDRANPAIAAAHARAETRLRKLRQEQSARSLELARVRLDQSLERLWKGQGRRQWIAHFAAAAVTALPHGPWVIEHPGDWGDEDRRVLEAYLAQQGLPAPSYSLDPSIRAGLRFCSGGIRLDATLAGLLADRYEIDGRLLNQVEGVTP